MVLVRDHKRDIVISGVSKSNHSVWVYHIDVIEEGLDGVIQKYTVCRRYNQFKELYEGLQKAIPGETSSNNHLYYSKNSQLHSVLPPFPNGGLWTLFKSSDNEFLEERKEGFQKLLSAANNSIYARNSKVFRHFIDEEPTQDELPNDKSYFSSYVSLTAGAGSPEINFNTCRRWKH